MSKITRRQFIKWTAASAAGLALTGAQPLFGAPAVKQATPPNLIFMHVDQQHFEAISALGSKYVRTPNMDRLVHQGTTFTMSYSANPICCPARACWYTGAPSSRNGLISNDHFLQSDMPDLGQWLGARGYKSFYSGKWHVRGRDPYSSFTCFTAEPSNLGEHSDPVISRSAQAFFGSYDGDKPFFLSLGFMQPHDCCFWLFPRLGDIDKLPNDLNEHNLPPLPDNFDCLFDEPAKLFAQMNPMRKRCAAWSPLQWRYYIWSYYRMVEMVDAEIGRVLDALEDSKFKSNTMIVFTSDHGDGLGRRRMNGKWFPYDEAARVPMIVVPPGGQDAQRDVRHVVSGLDVAPTLCDYAGVSAPPACVGRSLRPLVECKTNEWREFVVSECNITGRLLRTPEYKFVSYKDQTPELLFDMRRDPWEMHNLTGEASHADIARDLRTRLEGWEKSIAATG